MMRCLWKSARRRQGQSMSDKIKIETVAPTPKVDPTVSAEFDPSLDSVQTPAQYLERTQLRRAVKSALDGLDDAALLFVRSYAKSGDTRKASDDLRISHVKGAAMYKRADVATAIKAIRAEVQCDLRLDAGWVLRKSVALYENALEGEDVVNRFGDVVGHKDDRASVAKALELIGKHAEIRAFVDRKDITSNGKALEGPTYAIWMGDQKIEF